jgi:signal transduction histidine kinase/CheY-like chemotaxis protein
MLSWLLDALEAPLLSEDAVGIHLNEGARALFPQGAPNSMSAALRALPGAAPHTAALEAVVAEARGGTPGAVDLDTGARVLAFPIENGGVAVAFARPTAAREREAAASASHELANALGAIAGWARLARQGTRVDEALELIERSAESAWSTARRLLGKERRRQERALDLSAFVEESARVLSLKAKERNVEVKLAIDPAVYVRGDRGYAWSIVSNLATNALEAVAPGGTVELRVTRQPECAVVEVVDDGPGMTAEVRSRAFERRFTTKPAGSGLGLALVKDSAERLGGRVELDSTPGRGTRVRVEWPYASAPRAGRTRPSGIYYAGPLSARVLVVDDDDAVREMIATALRMRGAEVIAVAGVSDTLAQTEPFDLAIIDLQLGDGHGDALLARLRASGMTRRGMLVSGADAPAALLAGAAPDAVLRKPFDLDDLFALLPEEFTAGASPSGPAREATRTL